MKWSLYSANTFLDGNVVPREIPEAENRDNNVAVPETKIALDSDNKIK